MHHYILVPGIRNSLTVTYTVKHLMELGAPAAKLVLGMPTYGRSFTVSGSTKTPPIPASGGGNAGPITKTSGYLGYQEICLNIKNAGWTAIEDEKGPYAYSGSKDAKDSWTILDGN